MSEIGSAMESKSAKAITAQAAAWIERKMRDDWQEADEATLETWLSETPANRIAYWRLEGAWIETYRLAAMRPSGRPVPKQPASWRIWPMLASSIVAVVVIVVGFVASKYFKDEGTTYSTGLGERKTLTFVDGSQIELNTDTVLRASFESGSRNVWLDKGEAYFRIKHDANHPFAVEAAHQRITDLGTEFSVQSNAGRLKIAVLKGRVQFDGTANGAHTELIPGDLVVATSHTLSLTRTPVQDLASNLSWREGKLVFHHTSLNDVAAEFNRYNAEKVVVVDADARGITINGTFATSDTKAFAQLAQAVLGLRVEDHGNQIVISH